MSDSKLSIRGSNGLIADMPRAGHRDARNLDFVDEVRTLVASAAGAFDNDIKG